MSDNESISSNTSAGYTSSDNDDDKQEYQYFYTNKDDFLYKITKLNWPAPKFNMLSDELKNDVDVVLTIIKKKNLDSLYYIKDLEISNNRDAVLEFIEEMKYLNSIRGLKKEFRSDKEIMLAVIEKDGRFLRKADKKLLDDDEFILEVMEYDYDLLEFASQRLRDDNIFMRNAILKYSVDLLRFASERLKNDRQFLLDLINNIKSSDIHLIFSKRYVDVNVLDDNDFINMKNIIFN